MPEMAQEKWDKRQQLFGSGKTDFAKYTTGQDIMSALDAIRMAGSARPWGTWGGGGDGGVILSRPGDRGQGQS